MKVVIINGRRKGILPLHPLSYQHVGQQDRHDNEKDDPNDVSHLWKRGQQTTGGIVVAKYTVIVKLPSGHRHCLDEGVTSIPKGGSVNQASGIVQLKWMEEMTCVCMLQTCY